MRPVLLLHFLFVTGSAFAQLSPVSAPGGIHKVRIPVEIRHNLILLRVSINGSLPLRFILDTGVKNTLLIEPLLLSVISLDTNGMQPAQVRGIGSPLPVPATRFRKVKLQLGDCSLHTCALLPDADLLVLPEGVISYGGMFGLPIAGIIGSEVFSAYVVKINYIESYIELIHKDYFKIDYNKWNSFTLFTRNNKPYLEATLLQPDSSTVKRIFLLDSGSSSAVLLSDPAAPPPPNSLRAVIGTGIGGAMEGKLCRYPAVQLGDFALSGPIVGLPDSLDIALLPRDQGYYANLGADILSRFHLIFDYSRSTLWLRPNSNYRKPFSYNFSGLEVAHTTAGQSPVVIQYVRPGSPGSEAGLQPGDTLLQIQHLEVSQMDIQEVYGRLSPDPGQGVCVQFIRTGTRIRQQACYRTRDELQISVQK